MDGKVICRCQPSGRWKTHISKPILLENGRCMSQSPSPRLIGGRGFYKEGVGNGTKRSREEVAKFPMCRWVQSIPAWQVMVWCAFYWFSYSGFTPSWLHITLALRLKVSKYPGAGMPQDQILYLLKLFPRILIHTCYSSTSYILVRLSTYRNNVKRMVGWVTIPRYNFPLLQFHQSAMEGASHGARGRFQLQDQLQQTGLTSMPHSENGALGNMGQPSWFYLWGMGRTKADPGTWRAPGDWGLLKEKGRLRHRHRTLSPNHEAGHPR